MQRLFILLFILFSSVILGDNVSDSLLLSYYDASILPVMFMVNALFLFLVSSFFMTLIDRVDRGLLLMGVVGIHIAVLLGVKIAMSVGASLAYPFLYSYSYASKMILFMVFWTVVNDIVDARDAKRLFPKIAAGGVLGGITISFAAAFLAKEFGAEGLLVVWILIVSLSLPVAWSIHSRFLPHLRAVREPSSGGKLLGRILDFRLLRRDPLLRHMALIYFLTFILLYAHDFIFLSSLKENFLAARTELIERIDPSLVVSVLGGEDINAIVLKRAVPTFLGLFKGVANSVTLLLQFTVAGFILRSLGTVRAMLVMPICFVLAYGAILLGRLSLLPNFAPSGYPFFGSSFFLVVIAGLTARIALFDAVYSPNFQIFFSALNKDIRGRGKILIEGVIKPFAILAAGLFILFIYKQYPTGATILLFCFAIFLVILCVFMRKSYTQSIARSLGDGREERLKEMLLSSSGGHEDNTLPLLKDFLDDQDPEIADFATASLAKLSGEEPVRLLWGRFTRADSKGRIRFMRILAPLNDLRYVRLYEAGLYDVDGDVLAASMEALISSGVPLDKNRFTKLLAHTHPGVRAGAAAGLWRTATPNERIILEAAIRELLISQEPGSLEAGIRAASASAEPTLWNSLESGLNVAVSYGGEYRKLAIESAGSFNDPRACKWLINRSSHCEGNDLDEIDQALSTHLLNHLGVIEEAFNSESQAARACVVRALVIKRTQPTEPLRRLLEDLLELEVHLMLRYELYSSLLEHEHDGERLLAEAVHEKRFRKNMGHFFLVAAAIYPTAGLQSAANRVGSINRHVRASALELLDSTSSLRPVKLFLRLCDKSSSEWIRETLRREWQDDIPTRYFVLKVLSEDEDNWIKSLAIFSAIENDRIAGSTEYLDSIGLNRVSAFARLAETLNG